MIKLEHVSKAYSAGIPALNDVSLHIKEGEFCLLYTSLAVAFMVVFEIF